MEERSTVGKAALISMPPMFTMLTAKSASPIRTAADERFAIADAQSNTGAARVFSA